MVYEPPLTPTFWVQAPVFACHCDHTLMPLPMLGHLLAHWSLHSPLPQPLSYARCPQARTRLTRAPAQEHSRRQQFMNTGS